MFSGDHYLQLDVLTLYLPEVLTRWRAAMNGGGARGRAPTPCGATRFWRASNKAFSRTGAAVASIAGKAATLEASKAVLRMVNFMMTGDRSIQDGFDDDETV